MDYFELFELPVSLVVDLKELTRKYYSLNKKFHPDKFSLANIQKQNEALEISSKVNQAMKILSSPDKRLAYILKEKGVILEEEKYQLSPVFLGEMMELNETLMELEFEPNVNTTNKLKEEVQKLEKAIMTEVEGYFLDESLEIGEEDAVKLKDYYYKKKYLERIKEKL